MTNFKVEYTRPKPADAVQFDPNLRLVDIMDLPSQTPEDAIMHIERNMPWMKLIRIEKLGYGEYGDSSRILPSGAVTTWPNDSTISANVSSTGMAVSAFVSNYSAAQTGLSILRTMGVPETVLKPLQQNIEIMRSEADREKNELELTLERKAWPTLERLTIESEHNRDRQILASRIVETIVACNLLSERVLRFRFFNVPPETISRLHTPCNDENEFKMKIGALAVMFEIDLKMFKTLIRNAQDDWK